MLTGPITGAAVPIQHGDVGFVSVWTPDADRAAAFYGHVLGWVYDPSTRRVTNTGQRIAISPVAGEHTLFCCYAVTDLAGARTSILAGGGSVDETERVRLRNRAARRRIRRAAGSPSSSRIPASRARS